MKRKVFALLAGMMVLALGATTVMAADSPTATVVVDEITADDTAAVDEAVAAIEGAGLTTVDGSVVTGTVVDKFNIHMSDDVEPTAETVVTIEVDVEGELTFLHLSDAGWEIIASVDNEDGTYTLTFPNGFSPVIVVKDAVITPASSDTEATDAGEAAGTSPTTGEASALPILAVAILAGIVVCGKKIKNYA